MGSTPVTTDNFDKALTALQDIRPFQPFSIELIGGRRFEVDGPHTHVVRHGVAVFVAPGGHPILFDHDSVLRIIAAPAHAAE
jgi:hypothetical protein